MKIFSCTCGNHLFYENTQCLGCGREVGWCPVCQNIVDLQAAAEGLTCGNPECGAALVKCDNYALENVCNRCLAAAPGESLTETLCDCCRYNDTIPDLSIPENHERWYRLEVAKRRLFYDLNLLGLPYGNENDGFEPRLAFDFKSDAPEAGVWRKMGETERVYTGHANGKITINIREADDAERERLRVDFKEAHRTLIGHFRHEIGHYYWDYLVPGRHEDEFKAAFGDHEQVDYAAALERYYAEGPAPGWQANHISAYAAMHPWEDFAETFATYLDLLSVLDTARHFGGGDILLSGSFDDKVRRYQRLGIMVNELNRSMGLIDLVPEVIVAPVIEKMRCIDSMVHKAAAEVGRQSLV